MESFLLPGFLYQWTKSEFVCWNVEVINFVYAPNIEELFLYSLFFHLQQLFMGNQRVCLAQKTSLFKPWIHMDALKWVEMVNFSMGVFA
jgi:hypothetical protein